MHIGCHLSSSNGFEAMGKQALELGGDTFQFFTRNPRGSKAKAIDPQDAEKLMEIMKDNNFPCILAHAPYTLNPCSSNPDTRQFAHQTMEDDLRRMEYTPNQYYNFHPGSHTGQGVQTGMEEITEQLNCLLTSDQTTIVLLETMAGKGTEVGSRFEELAAIIKNVDRKEKMGVCLDTCHVYDAGYDIVNQLDQVLDEFDQVIGLDYLKAIHLNDSKNPFESHKDRHECIGKGYIGIEAMKRIITHPKLKSLPFFLETPNDLEGYRQEIAMIRKLAE